MLRNPLYQSVTLALLVLLPVGGCQTVSLNPSQWKLPSLAGEAAPPGTPEWWKKNKGKALFEPGEGYQVAGVDGYFDQEGRPIKTRVSKVVSQEKSGGLLGDVSVMKTVDSLKNQVGMGRDQQIAKEAYAAGEDLFRREQYRGASKQFKQAIARGVDPQLEQDALFMLAESQFYDAHYAEATDTYDQLIKKYSNSPHLDNVIRRQFDIARYWEQHHQYKPHWAVTPNVFDKKRPLFDTLGRSLKTYENIRLNDPTGPLADDAIMATANSHFLRGRYEDAEYHYGLIRREYPRSEHQFDAHLLGLQSMLRIYQGPDYDGKPLEEAKRLVKQLKGQFAGELDDKERERLAEVDAQLNKHIVMREWRMAKYYDNIEQFGSARFYYARVLQKHPESELASQARDRLIALGDSPDHPKEKLDWLLAMVPQNAERKAIAQVPLVEQPDSHIEMASGTTEEIRK